MNFLNRFKYARDSYFITILIIAIALMVNFIASHHFIRVDLTKNQLYAVSGASKSIMRNLDDIVTVKVFFSEKLPPNLFAVRQYVDDILDELVSYSKGNLTVDFLNPSEPDVINEALRLGIPQIQMNIVEKDKLEVKNGFLGVAVIYGDKTETLPVVQNLLNVEYDLVAAIKKVTAAEERVVGFLTGHDEPTLEQSVGVGQRGDSYSILKQALDRNYKVLSVNLEEGESLEGVDTLLIAGSKTAFSEEEMKEVDQFFTSGGNVVVFLDSIHVTEAFEASVLEQGLDGFLEQYGIQIEKQFVLDQSNERASFNQGFVNFIMPYPFWVKSVYLDSENPIVAKLDSIVFPWSSPLKIGGKEGFRATILADTTPNAWLQAEPFNLDPGAVQNFTERGQYPLAALLENVSEDAEEDTSFGRMIVVGNSRFATDRFISLFRQNIPFAMNIVDFLTLDESLISIRSKTSFDLPLKELSVRDRQLVKFVGTLLMPILVVVFGIVRFLIRRKRKSIF